MDFLFNVLIALGVMTVIAAVAGACCGFFDVKKKKMSSAVKPEMPKELDMRAFVKCAGGNVSERRYTLADTRDCVIADALYGGMTECRSACLGLGNCVSACRKNALSIKNGIAAVDTSLCDGCGECIGSCPRSVISLIPKNAMVKVACNSSTDEKELSELCDIGCIGCGTCVNTCEYNAIKLENNVAEIDYEKCTSCAACRDVCPRGIIIAPKKEEPRADAQAIALEEVIEELENLDIPVGTEDFEEIEEIGEQLRFDE